MFNVTVFMSTFPPPKIRYMGVSKNRGKTPQIIPCLMGVSIIFTIHFGGNGPTPFFGSTPISILFSKESGESAESSFLEVDEVDKTWDGGSGFYIGRPIQRNPANQLRLVVYPIIYMVLAPSLLKWASITDLLNFFHIIAKKDGILT